MIMKLNELAKKISELEGKKEQMSIAQISEVLACLGCVLKGMGFWDRIAVLRRLVKET